MSCYFKKVNSRVASYFLGNAEIWRTFFTKPGKVTPLVKWNKLKERAPREMHFHGIKSSKTL